MRTSKCVLWALFGIGLLVLSLVPACAPSKGPRVEQVTLCQSLSSDQACTEPATSFQPADTVYCTVKVSDLPAGSQVTARWFRGEDLVSEYTLRLDQGGTGRLGFHLAPSPTLQPGDYRVEILLAGTVVQKATFQVKGEEVVAAASAQPSAPAGATAAPPSPTPLPPTDTPKAVPPTATPRPPTATATRGISPTRPPKPIVKLPTVLPTTPAPTTATVVPGSPAPATATPARGSPIPATATPAPGSPAPATATPAPGTPSTSGPVFSEFVFAAGVTDDDQPINPATVFPPGTTEIYAFFAYANMRDGLEWQWIWYKDREQFATSDVYQWEGGESGRWWLGTVFDQGLEVGQYALGVYVNGELVQAGEFAVSEEVQAVPTPTGAATASVTGPSGRLAYTLYTGSQYQIWKINLDGTGQQWLADLASEPSWSPDGQWIAFYGWEGREAGNGIWVMKADGSQARALLNDGNASFINWSPDGRYIIFFSQRGEANLRVYLYDIVENKDYDIVGGQEPAWAPDARRIVYKGCVGSACGLFVAGRDGSNPRRITDINNAGNPNWSPDGRRIAFISDQPGNWEIYTVNADGSGLTRLTNHNAIDAHPVWTPDSNYIVFRSNRGGRWGIWIMNADGSNPRKLINANVSPDWWFDRMSITR